MTCPPPRRLATLGAAALVVVAAGGSSLPDFGTADASRPLIAKADAAALLDATSGEQLVANRATGADALMINANMPFVKGAIAAARPFDLPASDVTDYRRALLCLTQAVYYEAGNEPLEGRRAVAQVVLNRLRHPAFPKSVCGVVYQGSREPVCQFSFVCDGSLYRRPALGAWKEAEAIARAALNGFVEQSVGGATHYHANYVAPYWAPKLAKLTQIGAHIFYRWPGAWGSSAAFTGHYVGEPNDPLSLRPPLRPAVVTVEGETVVAAPAGPITDGTVLNRAQNDVGGLLDTSKGWTLNIPMPSETGSAARTVAATQRGSAAVAAAPATGTQVAGL
ncbi:cell wall hydrolase [Sphingomonas jaspsi]|uniref:cell wall hydrolase n=1 Tax=Sphingomonas jaspsi TaxID=392409 RepID=UPI0004AFC0C5|nr:cell wall hydrolase [Sphingomonas jaspsi]